MGRRIITNLLDGKYTYLPDGKRNACRDPFIPHTIIHYHTHTRLTVNIHTAR